MQHITGTDRYQTTFTSLDDLIAPDNKVRIIDAFVERLDLQQLNFNTKHKSEGRPPFDPKVSLKLYLDNKSRVKRDFYARLCERFELKCSYLLD